MCILGYLDGANFVQAVYSTYCGDLPKALEHFLRCANWQKAHSVFVTSVAHSLFLSGKYQLLLCSVPY